MAPIKDDGHNIPRGVFLNSVKANCSIYESGLMAYRSLILSERFDLEYREINATSNTVGDYDFYLFNSHHATMAWLNALLLQKVHPPLPRVPSRLGQVNPASMVIFCTLCPNWRRK